MSNALVQFARSSNKDIFIKEFGPISSTGYGIKVDARGEFVSITSDGTKIASYNNKKDKYDGYFKPVVNINRPHILPEIKDVIFDPPYTIVKWKDSTITKVRCIEENEFNEEIGLSMAISRKYYEVGISAWGWAKDKKENKGARAEFKNQVKNAKRPRKKVKNNKKSNKKD